MKCDLNYRVRETTDEIMLQQNIWNCPKKKKKPTKTRAQVRAYPKNEENLYSSRSIQ